MNTNPEWQRAVDRIAELATERAAVLEIARQLAEHLVTDKGLSCKICDPNGAGVLVGHKEGCPVKKLEAYQ